MDTIAELIITAIISCLPADGERDVDERDELLEDDDADDGERRLGAGAGAGCGATMLNCDASWPAIAINFAWQQVKSY